MADVRVSARPFERLGTTKTDIPPKMIVSTVTKLREDATRAGLDYKRPENVRDSRARTCRANDGYRMVLCDAGISSSGEHVIVAIDILPHDDAYLWCENNEFHSNPVTGSFDVIDVAQATSIGAAMGTVAAARPDRMPVFAAVRDRELTALGVPEDLIPVLRVLNDAVQVEALGAMLPPAVSDALIGLAAGMTVQEVWTDVQQAHAAPGQTPDLDTTVSSDIEELAVAAIADEERARIERSASRLADAALSPSSSAFLHTFTDDDDLLAALKAPLARWRVYLHPRQQAAARHRRYSEPARVTGGPGTGKSIVAIHRVAHLLGRTSDTDRILLTTYTRSLSRALQANLVELVGPQEAQRVDVRTLDSVPGHIGRQLGVVMPTPVMTRTNDELWGDAADRIAGPRPRTSWRLNTRR